MSEPKNGPTEIITEDNEPTQVIWLGPEDSIVIPEDFDSDKPYVYKEVL